MANKTQIGWLGILAPLVLALVALVDGVTRLLPVDRLTFRAWEAVSLRHRPTYPFEANRLVRKDRAYGDLSHGANRPDLRQYHIEIFTTDRNGFRNPPPLADNLPPKVLLAGSSFSAGCSLSDHETYSQQLGQRLGTPVYNIAGKRDPYDYIRFDWFQRVIGQLNMKTGLVIFEFPEREDIPIIPAGPRSGLVGRVTQTVKRWNWVDTCRMEWDSLSVSRVGILAKNALKSVQNDIWLPWVASPYIEERALQDGQPMLFVKEHLARCNHPRPRPTPDYWLWLKKQLDGMNLQLMIVLLPEKPTVYGALLRQPEQLPGTEKGFLAQIEEDLNKAGIPVLNMQPLLCRKAQEEFAHGHLIYWADDTHWNALGAAFAAEKTFSALQQSGLAPKSSP